jgi:hypothetical protein
MFSRAPCPVNADNGLSPEICSSLFRREAAEEAVAFVVWTGGEVKGVGIAAIAPLPNMMVHNPSMTIACPLGFLTLSRNSPVVGLNALMRPSPKLPINRSPPNSPKLAGASVTPQGEFSCPC